MAILRTDIERALDELASQEEGMRFQALAVVLGKKRWPELIAHQRKKDFGLDAYVPASLTPEKIGKGLAASITPALKKISGDAKTAKENFPDLKMLLFVTPAKVGNTDRKRWQDEIYSDHGLELHIIEREEIITQMMMPENASLLASFLQIDVDVEPQIADLIERIRRATGTVTQTWASKTKGHPLIDLAVVRLDPNGTESTDVLSLEQIGQLLSQSRRIVLEGAAGHGKTTTLIQLAQRARATGIVFIVELSAWTSSRRGILEYIAGMPAFQAEGLTATDLARAQQTEPFLLLLNGWNEIAESNSVQANDALRDLERDFSSAGIIVATRTHHLTPPLPGALWVRLLRLGREQRAAYLTARLGVNGAGLLARIYSDPSLDELTRTPFILSEVASLFEASAEIPSTKIGVLEQVIRLQERRDEHRNALQSAPLFGRQTDYLKVLGAEMTRLGTVALPEADARSVISVVVKKLSGLGQIEVVGAPAVLAALTAHHVLMRVDYPYTAFQFEHQQIQEYYAALDVHAQLLDLRGDNLDAVARFTSDYVNNPVWAEPLRMIAEALAEQTDDCETDKHYTRVGQMLVEMALTVDLTFAGELAQLCGRGVWNEVRAAVGERLRAVFADRDDGFRHYATAAMLATGADDFSDIIVPLLSGEDQQTRLRTYRLWPDIQVSSLGPNWQEQVRGWSEESRSDFVSELLHHRVDGEVAAFAATDDSIAVRKAAISGLMWTGSDDALVHLLRSMDAQTFENVARESADSMPVALRSETVTAIRNFVQSTKDPLLRLRAALTLIELGETGLDGTIKDAMGVLSGFNSRALDLRSVHSAVEYLHKIDPIWTSEWVAIQIAEGALYGHEQWLPFATDIPVGLVEKYLQRLRTEDLRNARFGGMVAVIAARADATLAASVFSNLRELRRKMDSESGQRHEFEAHVTRQLEAVFFSLSDNVAAAGVLSSVANGDALDLKIATGLLNRIGRSDVQSLHIGDDDLRVRLRMYLKSSVDLVLRQDDFSGEEKANLACSIAQVGEPEDITDLMTLIRADIARLRRGRAARAAGDRGSLGNGGVMSYARWHLAAVKYLDLVDADQVLIDLLPEPEYLSDVAAAMVRDRVAASPFNWRLRYGLMWDAREGRAMPSNGQQRTRFVAALNAEIKSLQEQNQDGKAVGGLRALAMALAAIDGRGSAAAVLDVIAIPGQWDQYIRLEIAERLLMAGVVLPTATVFALLDSILEKIGEWVQDSDKGLLLRTIALCPLVENPAVGIAKMRDVISKRRLLGYDLRELVTAIGESRSDAAIDLLYELASDAQTFEQCEDNFINALAALNTQRGNGLLLGFVDPDINGIALKRPLHREDVLVARLTELVQRKPEVAKRLQELCERDLPELKRLVLSRIMDWLGTPEAAAANLNLIDDAKPMPIPRGVWDQFMNTFVERRPNGRTSGVFTEHARSSNELRRRLFKMVIEDEKRRKSAFMLLGQVEEWRLTYGRPSDEPRHPDFASGQSWPPEEP